MRGNFFMQLLLALALILLSGGNSQPVSRSEMVELLKYAAGDNSGANEVLREAEQVSSVLEAIAPIAQAFSAGSAKDKPQQGAEEAFAEGSGNSPQLGAAEILKPVANIADDGIYAALTRAVGQ